MYLACELYAVISCDSLGAQKLVIELGMTASQKICLACKDCV